MMLLRYAFNWNQSPDIPAGSIPFSYHRGLRPMLWALIGASILEIVVLHLVVALFWSEIAAMVLAGLSVLGLVYLIGFMVSLEKSPLLVTDVDLIVRTGTLFDQRISLSNISDVAAALDCGDVKRDGFLKASLIAYPNVLITLCSPIRMRSPKKGWRVIDTIGLRPDDAAGFVAAIEAARRAHMTP